MTTMLMLIPEAVKHHLTSVRVKDLARNCNMQKFHTLMEIRGHCSQPGISSLLNYQIQIYLQCKSWKAPRKWASHVSKVIINQKGTKKALPLPSGSLYEHENVAWKNQGFSIHYSLVSSKTAAIQTFKELVLSSGMAEQPWKKKKK